MFHGVIHKITLAQFFLRHGVLGVLHYILSNSYSFIYLAKYQFQLLDT